MAVAANPQDQEEEADSPQLQPGGDGWTESHDAGYQLGLEHAAAAASKNGSGAGGGVVSAGPQSLANLPRKTVPRPTLGTNLTSLTTSALATSPLNVSRTSANPDGVTDALPAPTTPPFMVAQLNPAGLPRTPAVGGTAAVLPPKIDLPRTRKRNQSAVTQPDPREFFRR